MSNAIATTATPTTVNVQALSLAQLVDLYNRMADGIVVKPVKKFTDRKSAERRVTDLLACQPKDEVLAIEPEVTSAPTPAEAAVVTAKPSAKPRTPTTKKDRSMTTDTTDTTDTTEDQAAGKPLNPAHAAAIKASMQLDRRVMCVETGEVWPNVRKLFAAQPTWMTNGKRLAMRKALYGAAKTDGTAAVFTVTGTDEVTRTFRLVNPTNAPQAAA